MRLTIILAILAISFQLNAQETKENSEKDDRCNDPNSKIECGWHYGYIDPFGDLIDPKTVTKPTKKPTEEKKQKKEPSKPKKKCTDINNWDESCGFIDPGEDFDFQSKQRDIFLKGLIMKSGSPKAVKNMQKYQRWVLDKAIEASNVWEFNLVQDPTLSAAVKKPTSAFGIHAATQIRQNTTAGVMNEVIEQGGYFVWFTRSDCAFCHKQLGLITRMGKQNQLPIRNVSLDGECMKGFEKDCVIAPYSLIPAKDLGVQIVPSIYLYLPKDDTYIRISNGLESLSTINNRVKNFFLAVKAAVINGTENGQGRTPSVNFNEKFNKSPNGTSEIE